MAVNVISGAKALIKFDQEVVGYATGVSVTETTFNGRVDSIGYIDTREITPIGRNVTAVVNMIRIFTPGAGSEFTGLQDGDVDEGQIVNTINNSSADINGRTNAALLKKPFTLSIFDSAPGDAEEAEIYRLEGCRIASQNIVVDRGSLMGVQCVIEATHMVRFPGADIEGVAGL